jgi:ATP-dependent Clp protease ATP-binding subunit ClpA
MPFARTPQAALERWLRILRLYGDAGAALQSLGVGEDRVQVLEESADRAVSAREGDGIEQVCEKAWEIAHQHGGGLITTGHLLLAVMSLYGAEFDRVLQAHGCDREELAQRLGASFVSC